MNCKLQHFLFATAISLGMANMASAQKIDIGILVTPSIPVDDVFSVDL